MSRLLDETPIAESTWSIKQTVPVDVLCFIENEHRTLWISQRLEGHARGLLEIWDISSLDMTIQTDFVPLPQTKKLYEAPQIVNGALDVRPLHRADDPERQLSSKSFLGRQSYSYDAERDLVASGGAQQFIEAQRIHLLSQDRGRLICTSNPQSNNSRAILGAVGVEKYLHLHGTDVIAQSSLPDSRRIAAIDAEHRVVIGDLDRETLIGLSI